MNATPTMLRVRSLIALAVCLMGMAVPAAAACPEEDVWVVSTRRLPGVCALPSHATFDVEQRIAGRWERTDVTELLADPSRPLVIFIHGNRYEPHDAKAQGIALARRLAACGSSAAAPRTVVFSWPSEQQGRLIASSRDNYRRSYADGHYLARLLADVSPEQPVAIIGYSFGGTIAVGAIEDLVEAQDDPSTSVPAWVGRPGRTHLVLVAPACRHDALAPRGPFAAAASGIDRLTLVINSRDLALKMFPHLDPQIGTDALGTVGMPRRWLPGGVEFAATDAAAIVGRKHAFPLYLESGSLAGRIASGALAGLAGE
jgi:esterase/lipase superfamily enzyme